MPGQQVPRRHGKDPILPKNPTNRGITEERNDQRYSERSYFPTEAELEIQRLNRLLAYSQRQLAEANKKRAGRPKKETSYRRNETEVTETESVYTVAQTRTVL